MTARHYYRCGDCLGVCASAEQIPVIRYSSEIGSQIGKCGACGGYLEYMGRVQRDRLVTDELRTACDHRCTGAIGPHCDCRCGGENHGTGLMIEFTRDQGPVPVAKMHNAPTLQREAGIFRGLVEAIRDHVSEKYGEVIEAKRRGEYVERYAHYCQGTGILRQLADARQMRSHHGRNARLRDLMKKNGINEPPPTWTEQPAAEWTTSKPAHTTRASQAFLF